MSERILTEATGAAPMIERQRAARELEAAASAEELRRAVAAVAAVLGGPHCAVDGRGAEEWIARAVAELLAEGRPLAVGLPLWVALRDRAAEQIVARRSKPAASAMGESRALERRVVARMVPQRLDVAADRVLRALCDGITRTDEIAALLGLTVAEVMAARRAIAATADAVSEELRGGARRV